MHRRSTCARTRLLPLAGLGALLCTFALSNSPALASTGYACTGAAQSETVPAGAVSATVNLQGAAGQDNFDDVNGTNPDVSGGRGESVNLSMAVTPGQTIGVAVGCQAHRNMVGEPVGGFGGGGSGGRDGGGSGGGATTISLNGTLVAVAGGGGGAGGQIDDGEPASAYLFGVGGPGGDAGANGANGGAGDSNPAGYAGQGGASGDSGGLGGQGGQAHLDHSSVSNGSDGGNGAYLQAGDGGAAGEGEFGTSGGGGGGGYAGGGGGGGGSMWTGYGAGGGGGGGSSYVNTAAGATESGASATVTGDGSANITFHSVANLSPGTKGFGHVNISHRSATQTFTLASPYTAMTVGTATVTGAHASAFPITGDSCSGRSLAAGDSCTVTVQFAPTGTGDQAATLSIPSDAANGTVTASLTGTGQNPPVAGVQSDQDFGEVATGSSMQESIVVQNISDSMLTVGQASLGGTDVGQFALGTDGCSGQRVAPGDICQVHVEFSPASLGAKQATLTIPSDDPNSPATVTLTATGRAPATPPTEQPPPTQQPPTVTPPVSNPSQPPLVNSHTLTAHHPVRVTVTAPKSGKVTLTLTGKVHGKTTVIGTVTVNAGKAGQVSYKMTTKFAGHKLAKGAYTLTAKAPGGKTRSAKLNVR